jgi:hypothetical protein
MALSNIDTKVHTAPSARALIDTKFDAGSRARYRADGRQT